jgi:hypothetical protein
MARVISVLPILAAASIAAGCGAPSGVGAPAASDPASPAISDRTAEPTDAGLRVSTAGWSTDFSRYAIRLDEIISGGPGKDGIPAIDDPKFEAVASVDWLEPKEPVIAFGIGEDWRAYPIQILVWHEIVNDTVADTPVTITFCPLCHTAIAFDRRVGERVLDFGTTGNLRHSDLVMYDRLTESWWQQVTGQAIVGELTGTQLEFLPSQLISWESFRTEYPNGQVLSRDTGHFRNYGANPYAGYDSLDSEPFLLQDATLIDGRLSPKVRIVGLQIDDEAVAYPFPFLSEARVVNDEVAGTSVVVIWRPGTASALDVGSIAHGADVGAANAFNRQVADRALTFEPAGNGQMRDRETGSLWSFAGRAVEGELVGTQLELLVSDSPFWFAWAIFRPDTRIWQPDPGATP